MARHSCLTVLIGTLGKPNRLGLVEALWELHPAEHLFGDLLCGLHLLLRPIGSLETVC